MMSHKSKVKDIYVADISFEVVEEDLQKLFSVCGTVKAINMLKDDRTGHFNGRAFIRMASDAEAKEAINMLDGTRLINRCISVSAARDKPIIEPIEETAVKKSRRPRPGKGRRK
ncbi:RNA recognition motif domain-containing protein [Geopsychrobacter electrodiphilus]|uniref:RNA recognition motif domain-containing protein n=1 Tax=Geopsychrobacter electrodiphilus TaxID=225196 RepID=UPI00037EE292|nr:RNA-binding protein [Geopsychrobacter electrodiphilus]